MNTTLAVPAPPRAGDAERSLLVIVALALVGVLVALGLRGSVEGRVASTTVLDGRLSLAYPASWVKGAASGGVLLNVADTHSPTWYSSNIVVRTRSLGQEQQLNEAAAAWTLAQSRALAQFTDLGSVPAVLDGRPAVRLTYAYVAPTPSGAGPATLPIVVRSVDTLTIVGNQVVIVSAASDASQFARYASYFERALASVKLAK